jgi:hypothetical protein
MSLNKPVLTGPGAGRTVTKSSGSSTELKLEGDQAEILRLRRPRVKRPIALPSSTGPRSRT